MTKKIIAPFLALGIITGSGAGIIALASETDTTTATTQTQTQTTETETATEGHRGPGGHMGHRGGGMGWGFGQADAGLTIDQQKDLNLLRAEFLNAGLDFQAEHQTLAEALKTAIESGSKVEILSAWDALTALETRVEAATAPILDQIQAITGAEDNDLKARTGFLEDKMEALKNASSDEEIQAAIEDLQSGRPGDRTELDGKRPAGVKGGRYRMDSGTAAEGSDGATSASPEGDTN